MASATLSRICGIILACVIGCMGPLANAQPSPDFQQFFIVRPAAPQEMVVAFDNKGASKKTTLTTWNFQNLKYQSQPWLPFGSYACTLESRSLSDCMAQQKPVFAVPAFDMENAPGLQSTAYNVIWNSEDTGSKDLGSAWQADTYFQYQAIGTVWSSGGSSDSPTPPNATAYYLVNSNCIQECSFNSSTPPQLVWSTNDYSKKVQEFSLWQPLEQLSISYGLTSLDKPASVKCLNPACVSTSQIYQITLNSAVADVDKVSNSSQYIKHRVPVISQTINNPTAAQVTDTVSDSKSITHTETLTLAQSVGYSETMQESDTLTVNLKVSTYKFEELNDIEFTDTTSSSNTLTTSLQQTFSIDVAVTAPAYTSMNATMLVYMSQQMPVPVTTQLSYSGFDYWADRYVNNATQLENLMYRSGFSGTIGAWTPGSGGNPGMLAATVNGTLSLTAAFNSEVVITCTPLSQQNNNCGDTTTVASAGKNSAATAEADGLQGQNLPRRRRKIRGVRQADGSVVYRLTPADVKFLNAASLVTKRIPTATVDCRPSRTRICL